MSKNTRTIGYGGNDVVKPAEVEDIYATATRSMAADVPNTANPAKWPRAKEAIPETVELDSDELADDIAGAAEELANAGYEGDLDKFPAQRTHSARDVLSYYPIEVKHPLNPDRKPYTVDAIDIIEALGMSYAEGSLFKALWRKCAVRQGVYRREQSDAQKMLFFSHRVLGDDVTPKGKKA